MAELGQEIGTYRGHIPHPWREARSYAHPASVTVGLVLGLRIGLSQMSSVLETIAFPVFGAAVTWVLVYALTGTVRPFERWRRKVVLHERGIVGQSQFGFRRSFLWEEIQSVKLVHSHYFFLVVSRRAKPQTLWIPWRVREPQRFVEQVAALAGAPNPLAEYLRRRVLYVV